MYLGDFRPGRAPGLLEGRSNNYSCFVYRGTKLFTSNLVDDLSGLQFMYQYRISALGFFTALDELIWKLHEFLLGFNRQSAMEWRELHLWWGESLYQLSRSRPIGTA